MYTLQRDTLAKMISFLTTALLLAYLTRWINANCSDAFKGSCFCSYAQDSSEIALFKITRWW